MRAVQRIMLLSTALLCASALHLPVKAGSPSASRRAAVSLVPALLLPVGLKQQVEAAEPSKEYTKCLSQCVYDTTKITKGIAKACAQPSSTGCIQLTELCFYTRAQVEVKSRDEAFVECKPQCAKYKQKPSS